MAYIVTVDKDALFGAVVRDDSPADGSQFVDHDGSCWEREGGRWICIQDSSNGDVRIGETKSQMWGGFLTSGDGQGVLDDDDEELLLHVVVTPHRFDTLEDVAAALDALQVKHTDAVVVEV